MALSASVLSAAIRADVLAKGTTGARDTHEFTDLCDAIAAAVVVHITSAAVVTGTIVGVSPSGAVTGTCSGVVT